MTEEKYRKLNNYLNMIFKALGKNDSFLVDNLFPIAYTSQSFSKFIKEYDFQHKKIESYLTYDDVYRIAREIISTIDEGYLPLYDKIIDDGTLDFGYEQTGIGSYCYNSNDKLLINVEREFGYIDVCYLVHEFMHYTNNSSKSTINRYLLTEFISIYFELFTQKYLIDNYDVFKESIGIYSRLDHCKRSSEDINAYSVPFSTYLNIGPLNEEAYAFTNKYFYAESKEVFEDQCNAILVKCEQIEKDYRMNILYETQFNEDAFASYLINNSKIATGYRYLLGTLLAYYAIDNVDIKNIVALNNFINSQESSEMAPNDLLLRFGIDLNSFADKSFNNIEKILNDKKKKR